MLPGPSVRLAIQGKNNRAGTELVTRAPDQALGSLQLLSKKVTPCDQILPNQKRGEKAITTTLIAESHVENRSCRERRKQS